MIKSSVSKEEALEALYVVMGCNIVIHEGAQTLLDRVKSGKRPPESVTDDLGMKIMMIVREMNKVVEYFGSESAPSEKLAELVAAYDKMILDIVGAA